MSLFRRLSIPMVIFLTVLGAVAFTINEKTLRDFNLQQIGVESVAERSTFALEGSTVPELQPLGDTFSFQNHVYAIKQPGQFVLGAFVLKLLSFVRTSYHTSYVFTAALVTLGSSGVLLAALAVSIYSVAKRMTASQDWAMWIAFVTTLGTTLFPYAGVAHHDSQATALVFLAWMFAWKSRDSKHWGVALTVSGWLIGLSLFVSMLPIAICAVIGLWIWITFKKRQAIVWSISAFVGALPVFVFNFLVFKSPFAFPNTISGTTDTTPFLSLVNLTEKLSFYLVSPSTSLFLFVPLFLIAIVSVWFLRKKQRSVSWLIVTLVCAHVLYVCSIATVGHAQYGPRYLLPIVPFLGLALAGAATLHSKLPALGRYVLIGVLVIASLISVVINTLGAFGGVMYQTIWIYPVPAYLSALLSGENSDRPLATWGPVLMVIAGLWAIVYLTFDTRSKKLVASRDAEPTR